MTAPVTRAVSTIVVAVVLALVTGCSGDDQAKPTTIGPQFPSVAVDAWLRALDARDFDAAGALVDPVGASVVLAVENGLGDEPLAELIESGWTEDLTASFWSSFADEFPLFAGFDLGDIAVGRHFPVDEAPGDYAVVEVGSGPDLGWVITRRTSSGAWQVDLLATLGGAFVPLVFDRVDDLEEGAAADLIADVVRTSVLESLDAAAAAYPDDIRLETEIARIRQLIGSG
jgi:hypothetical protein